MPILMASAARAVMTKGDAICATPAATAVFMTVRRSSFIEWISFFILFLPWIFCAVPQAFVRLSALVATLMCDDEKTQDCRDSSGENIGSNHAVTRCR